MSEFKKCKNCGEILGIVDMHFECDHSSGQCVRTREYYKCRYCGTEEDIKKEEEE